MYAVREPRKPLTSTATVHISSSPGADVAPMNPHGPRNPRGSSQYVETSARSPCSSAYGVAFSRASNSAGDTSLM